MLPSIRMPLAVGAPDRWEQNWLWVMALGSLHSVCGRMRYLCAYDQSTRATTIKRKNQRTHDGGPQAATSLGSTTSHYLGARTYLPIGCDNIKQYQKPRLNHSATASRILSRDVALGPWGSQVWFTNSGTLLYMAPEASDAVLLLLQFHFALFALFLSCLSCAKL